MDAEPLGGHTYVRPAYGITELFNEINAAYPNRSKTSDGIVGDYEHSLHPSGHNPNVRGDVCAGDVTNDAEHCPGEVIAEELRARKDDRLLYVIWNRRIFDGVESDHPFTWHPYDGADPHTGHVHVSLRQDPHYYDDRSPWGIGEDDVTEEQLEAAIIKVLTTAKIVPIPGEAKTPTSGDKATVVQALTQDWGHDLRDETVDRQDLAVDKK